MLLKHMYWGKNELSIQQKKPDNNNKINPKWVEVKHLSGFNKRKQKDVK